MFAIIYGLFNLLGLTVTGIKAAEENSDCIKRAQEKKRIGDNPYNIYIDRKGATRDLETGGNVFIDYIGVESEGKDQYIRDIHGYPIRNLSAERRQQRLWEAKQDPRKTVCEWKKEVKPGLEGYKGNPYYAGKQYKDLITGEIYVCRQFPFPKEIANGAGTFYMNVNNGLLVREADSEKYDRQRGYLSRTEEASDKFIQWFNEKQRGEGYLSKSNVPRVSEENDTESELKKTIRMKCFYCNEFLGYDIPCDIKR